MISLDSEFEDSPRPETSKKKYEPGEPHLGLEPGYIDAGCSEANYENARIPERSIGTFPPPPPKKPNSYVCTLCISIKIKEACMMNTRYPCLCFLVLEFH